MAVNKVILVGNLGAEKMILHPEDFKPKQTQLSHLKPEYL